MKIGDVVVRLRAFNKAHLEPDFSRVVLDWSSRGIPPIGSIFKAILPDGSPEDLVSRFFRKIVDIVPAKKYTFVRGVFKPFSNEDYYKIKIGDIENPLVVYPDEFYEEKADYIESRLIPQLDKELARLAPGSGNLSFIARRTSGTFEGDVIHPYYYTFNVVDLVRFKQNPAGMGVVKKLLSRLEFIAKSGTGDVFFSILKTKSVLDLVKAYACKIRACKSRHELNDVFYEWNDRLSLVEIPVMAERYLQQLHEEYRSGLPE